MRFRPRYVTLPFPLFRVKTLTKKDILCLNIFEKVKGRPSKICKNAQKNLNTYVPNAVSIDLRMYQNIGGPAFELERPERDRPTFLAGALSHPRLSSGGSRYDSFAARFAVHDEFGFRSGSGPVDRSPADHVGQQELVPQIGAPVPAARIRRPSASSPPRPGQSDPIAAPLAFHGTRTRSDGVRLARYTVGSAQVGYNLQGNRAALCASPMVLGSHGGVQPRRAIPILAIRLGPNVMSEN